MTRLAELWRWRARIALAGLICLAVALTTWAFVIEPSRLVLHETRITLPHGPTVLKGLRVAVISDLHAGSPYITLGKIHQIVQKTNAARPDLILLPGDFIEGVFVGRIVEPEAIAAVLAGLRAPLGVFATLGNHDWWFNGPRVRKALEHAGIKDLENEAVRVDRDGEAIWIAGIGDKWTGSPDIAATLARIEEGAAVIAFTHNPDIFPSIPARVALTIAGHTHGGQVVLPIIGRPIVPSEFGQRYAVGHIVESARHLFVSSGVGTSILPVRFGVPPEISLLTIN
jgi:predicted MPP superfamily phosphohydrolase